MSTTADLMGLGMPPALAARLGNTPISLSGAGTTQTGATTIGGGGEYLLTPTSSNTAFVLSNAISTGRPVWCWNQSASQTALVYPPSGGKINNGSLNASISIPVLSGAVFMLGNGAGVAAENWGAMTSVTSGTALSLSGNLSVGGTMAVTGLTTVAGIGSSVAQQAYNTATNTTGFTATGANITGGSVKTYLNLTGTLGAGANIQLPTAAALVTAMGVAGLNPVAGSTYELDVMNSSSGAYAWTITTNTNWTLTGTMTIAQNTLRRCLITISSSTAATLQSLGEYAITAGI